MKIRKGDMVQIQSGKDRGRRGKVLEVRPTDRKVVVEGLNIFKKHTRPRRAGEKGQIVEFPAALPSARILLVCPTCQKAVRVALRTPEHGKKERYCRKCGATITNA